MTLPVQVSPKHKVVGVPDAPALRNLFPTAPQIVSGGRPHLVIPHRPVETFMLRKLGYDVPAPILTQYDWPHPAGEPPFDAQKRTAALLTMNDRAYVLSGMGTGKTRSALWSWDYLNKAGLAGKLLVFAPLSTLTFTWQREVFNLLPHRKSVVLHGTKKKRLERLAEDVDIYIINHDGLGVLLPEVMARTDITALVIDELAVYRNGTAERTKKLRKLTAAPHVKWVWGMTGSPMPNAPTDVWAQAAIVTPSRVPKYFTAFRNELMLKVSQFKYVPRSDAVERAFEALQPSVRFTLDDVYELPETIYRSLDVELGKQQAKVYKDMADKCFAAVQNHQITAANAGAVMSKLLQVSTGWVYTADHRTVPLDNQKRVEALMDAINSTDRKVIVFVPYKHALAGISEALTSEGYEHAAVSGDTPAGERSQIFNAFQNTSKYKVLAAHPQCLAHGITLTAADTIIWFAPITSLETYEQANARISRVGQKHKQLVLHLQSTPVEARIYSMLKGKQRVQDKLLDLFATATSEGNHENS